MASATESRPSLNKTALAVAWLTLAVTIAGLGGYLVVARQSSPQSAVRIALPAATEAEMAAADQAESEAGRPTGQAAGETADQTMAKAPTSGPAAGELASDPGASDPGASEELSDAQNDGNSDRPGPEEPGLGDSSDPDAVPDQTESGQTGPVQAETETPLPDVPPLPDTTQGQSAAETQAPSAEDNPGVPNEVGPEPDDQLAEAPKAAPAPALGKPLWQQFATAVEIDRSRPRIAVVVTGLGLSTAATEAAIEQLPAYVTLSFSPYARRLNQWIALARVKGHEVMLDLPMEPVGYPNLDPGPHALLTTLDAEQNLERLSWILKRGTSFIGVAAMMGSRFTGSEDHLYPVMKELKERGLLFLDNRAISSTATRSVTQQLGMPLLINDRAIDEAQASRVAIDSRLAQIERLALTNGAAVAMGQPYPVTIERLRDWTALLAARGFMLVPITALVPEAQSG